MASPVRQKLLSDLPIELLDLIASALVPDPGTVPKHDELNALQALSRTNSAFTNVCRRHIWDTISFSCGERGVPSSPRCQQRIDCLRSHRATHLVDHIRSLSFAFGDAIDGSGSKYSRSGLQSFTALVLGLPGVTEVSVASSDSFASLPWGLWKAICRRPYLDTLRLSGLAPPVEGLPEAEDPISTREVDIRGCRPSMFAIVSRLNPSVVTTTTSIVEAAWPEQRSPPTLQVSTIQIEVDPFMRHARSPKAALLWDVSTARQRRHARSDSICTVSCSLSGSGERARSGRQRRRAARSDQHLLRLVGHETVPRTEQQSRWVGEPLEDRQSADAGFEVACAAFLCRHRSLGDGEPTSVLQTKRGLTFLCPPKIDFLDEIDVSTLGGLGSLYFNIGDVWRERKVDPPDWHVISERVEAVFANSQALVTMTLALSDGKRRWVRGSGRVSFSVL